MGLPIALEDELHVAHPRHITRDEVHYVLALLALAHGDDMAKDALALEASHNQALDDRAKPPTLGEPRLALLGHFIIQFVTTLDASSRDIPEVDADYWYVALSARPCSMLTNAAPEGALLAPRSERPVCQSMFLNFGFGGAYWG